MTHVNRIYGLGTFLATLDTSDRFSAATPSSQPDPRRRTSPLVPPTASNFVDFLEPRIAPLVLDLIAAWGCTTYTSCEGHPGDIPAPATVGVLPLNDTQLDHYTCIGRELEVRVGPEMVTMPVAFHAVRTMVETAVGQLPVLELNFVPAEHDWAGYFAALPEAINIVRRELGTHESLESQ